MAQNLEVEAKVRKMLKKEIKYCFKFKKKKKIASAKGLPEAKGPKKDLKLYFKSVSLNK